MVKHKEIDPTLTVSDVSRLLSVNINTARQWNNQEILGVKFLYLSQEDMIEAVVLDMHKCIEVIDKAFKIMAKGDYLHGGPGGEEHGLGIFFPETPRGPQMLVAGPDRRFQALVGYIGGELMFAAKSGMVPIVPT